MGMGLLSLNKYSWSSTSTTHLHRLCPVSTSIRATFIGLHNGAKLHHHHDLRFSTRTFARRKSVKKPKKDEQLRFSEESNVFPNGSIAEDEKPVSSVKIDNFLSRKLATVPSRSSVLQACTVTCGFLAALGVIIRQVSHVASVEGLPIVDCSTAVSFGFETWHLELITGLVILVSSCRYLLLKTWPDFAESSEAANQQVLTSLEPLDYLIVALLPGVSEELLFRGALLPLFGTNWTSVLVAASIFGVLHLGSGRKYSFAVWSTFVGFLYGYATIVSKSIIVPMASHSVNNLVGGILWRYTSKKLK